MNQRYSNLKEELMDLIGTISIKELVTNKPLQKQIKEITHYLEGISLIKG